MRDLSFPCIVTVMFFFHHKSSILHWKNGRKEDPRKHILDVCVSPIVSMSTQLRHTAHPPSGDDDSWGVFVTPDGYAEYPSPPKHWMYTSIIIPPSIGQWRLFGTPSLRAGLMRLRVRMQGLVLSGVLLQFVYANLACGREVLR